MKMKKKLMKIGAKMEIVWAKSRANVDNETA